MEKTGGFIAMAFRKAAARLLITFSDAAALAMAFFYAAYVTLILALNLGTWWLNFAMLLVTFLYIVFFTLKIFYINKIVASHKLSRRVKKITKYTKYGMRLINAVFIILNIAAVKFCPQHILPIIGVIWSVMTFIFSIAWEVLIIFAKRNIKDVMIQWNRMEGKQKKEKIDFLLEKALETLDTVNIQEFGEYVEYGAKATEIVQGKLNSARTSAKRRKPLCIEYGKNAETSETEATPLLEE